MYKVFSPYLPAMRRSRIPVVQKFTLHGATGATFSSLTW
jgi:hypothetical protein